MLEEQDEMQNASEGTRVKPILKWAGGKSQLVPELLRKVPENFGKYIEPFFGGGALFFAMQPDKAVISDINPEIINLYSLVRDDVDKVIQYLKEHENNKDHFLEVRSLNWLDMPAAEAAARTIYLNKTCFNGLYRVNRAGRFNVPYGDYRNPKIIDETKLRGASRALQAALIEQGDFKKTLLEHAEPGDLIFLDPPYLPISKYSDFKRYNKEQFSEEQHVELAEEVKRLDNIGCYVVLTNSNHPLVHSLFKDFSIEVFQTRRHISARADKRRGEDVIVTQRTREEFPIFND